MSDRHALPDSDAIWRDTGRSTFLKVGSVVPVSVMRFNEDGTAVGLLADPTVAPPEIAEWARAELAHIPSWQPGPDVVSPHCGHPWPAPYGEWVCTLDPHGEDQRHEAWGTGELVAFTEALRAAS